MLDNFLLIMLSFFGIKCIQEALLHASTVVLTLGSHWLECCQLPNVKDKDGKASPGSSSFLIEATEITSVYLSLDKASHFQMLEKGSPKRKRARIFMHSLNDCDKGLGGS